MAKKKLKYGISNLTLIPALQRANAEGEMTEELGLMLQKLIYNITGQPNFKGYSFREDMQGNALIRVMEKWRKFDFSKSNNPFAYFFQVINMECIKCINKYKREEKMMFQLYADEGLDVETWEDKAGRQIEAQLNKEGKRTGPYGKIIPIDMDDKTAKELYGRNRGTKTNQMKRSKSNGKATRKRKSKPGT